MSKVKVKEEKCNLAEKAMLVQLQMGVWMGHSRDAVVSEQVQAEKGAERDTGSWWTYLIPRNDLKKVLSAYNKCRGLFNTLTLPWNDNGVRILPAAMFMKYSEDMRKGLAEYDEAVEEFVLDYPNIIQLAVTRLGKLAETRHIPSAEEIRPKFHHRVDIYPLPSASDFRVTLSDDEVKDIKAQITSTIEAKTNEAVLSVWENLVQLVQKVTDTLGNPDKKFKDSLIGNLRDYCELLPNMNITGDTRLEEMRKIVVEKLTTCPTEVLRLVPQKRKEIHNDAKDALEKIKEYSGL